MPLSPIQVMFELTNLKSSLQKPKNNHQKIEQKKQSVDPKK
jgi:hypothetical protein